MTITVRRVEKKLIMFVEPYNCKVQSTKTSDPMAMASMFLSFQVGDVVSCDVIRHESNQIDLIISGGILLPDVPNEVYVEGWNPR